MGLLAALLSALFSSSKDLMSKRLAFRLDGTVSTFASFAFALPFYVVLLTILTLLGYESFTCSLLFLALVLLRSITDTFGEWMKMYALAHGDLSVVAIAFAMSPLLLLIASPLITGDRLTLTKVLAVFLVVGGSMLVIARPPAKNAAAQKKGVLLAVGASLFVSLNSCFDRLAVKQGTPVFAGFTMTLLSAVFLSLFIFGRKDRLQALRTHGIGFLIRGLLEVSFMVCKLSALQFFDAPTVSAILRLSLLISVLGGHVFFREEDLRRKLAACSLILAGVFLIIWR
jgi:drug/metabolite transporter (DMT)-like permease